MSQERESRPLLTIFLMVVATLLCLPAFGKVIYVDDDAVAPGDGSSWQTAYKFLQDALVDAEAAEKPIEIRVAQGVYKPNQDTRHPQGGPGSPWTFELHGGMSLRGGFAGISAPDPNVQDTSSYRSVLTGDLADNDADLRLVLGPVLPWEEPTHQDNSPHVVEISGPGFVRLEGCIISGGFMTSRGGIDGYTYGGCGGGVLIHDGDAVIHDCWVGSNYAEELGGGVAAIAAGTVRLENCRITSNIGDYGGGAVYCALTTRMELLRCTLTRNWGSEGGAVYAGGGVVGGIWFFDLAECILSGNEAHSKGGALVVGPDNHVTITNSVFHGNRVWNPSPSNGVYAEEGAHLTLVNSILRGNRCLTSSRIVQVNASDPLLIDLTYCNVEGGWQGESNIDADPLFARAGHWDPNGTPDNKWDDFWVDGDYHLKSQAGRWDPDSKSWVTDEVASPCIDAGDPNSPIGHEPFPNGGRINIGAYGGTAEASKSPSGLSGKYGGGGGEAADPYLVFTAEHLREIGAEPGDWGRHFRLMADIDLGAGAGEQVAVLGTGPDAPFAGVFDGGGHTIAGFVCGNPLRYDSVGLFGYLSGTVRNVGLTDPSVDGELGYHAGALVGDNHGLVSDCFVEDANVAGGNWYAGGLVGRNEGTVKNCRSAGAVGGRSAGGLVHLNRGSIEGCSSTAAVAGDDRVGGLVGDNSGGTITNCWSAGMVTGDDKTGGLVGGNSDGTITGCYSTATVFGNDGVGGLVGENWGGTIANCYAAANVTGDRLTAGLVGDNGAGTIRNCYAAGPTVGRWPVGGLVAFRHDDDVVIASFWDTESTGCSWSAAGTGKTTAEMQTAATFLDAGWDFTAETKNGTRDLWRILEGQDYPRLSWE